MCRLIAVSIAFLSTLTSFLAAQQNILNGKLTVRLATRDLRGELQAVPPSASTWIGYAVPLIQRHPNVCCINYWGLPKQCVRCALDHGTSEFDWFKPVTRSHSQNIRHNNGSVRKRLLVFLHVKNGDVDEVRTFTNDCEVDAGNMPVEWLTHVSTGDSLATLASVARQSVHPVFEGDIVGPAVITHDLMDDAVQAIALHADPASEKMLSDLVAPNSSQGLRVTAVGWLAAHGRAGYNQLKMLIHDPSEFVRERVVDALDNSPEPEAVDTLIATARTDTSSQVRNIALFCLTTKHELKAEAAIRYAIDHDPDPDIRKRTIFFASSQLPKRHAIAFLIAVARSTRDVETRNSAMFYLGDSKDPHAIAVVRRMCASVKAPICYSPALVP